MFFWFTVLTGTIGISVIFLLKGTDADIANNILYDLFHFRNSLQLISE
ncbi:hypothetical protein GCM10020370_55540 [Paenibacillus hodogayensis]